MINRAEFLGTFSEKVSHIVEIVIMVMMMMRIVIYNDPMVVMMVHIWHSRWLASSNCSSDTASGSCIASLSRAFRLVWSRARHVIIDEVNLGEINQRIQDIIMSMLVAWCGW